MSQRFGFSPDVIYGKEFYDGPGFAKTRQSANKIATFLQESFSPANVLDIGCGPGEYLRAFTELGTDAVGCDGASDGIRRAPISAFSFVHDLRKPLVTNKKFDLVMCIEVAEHLLPASSDILCTSICGNADQTIVFTAAPEGCPGDDHINCQPFEFWSKRFLKEGFEVDYDMTARLRKFASENDLAQWWQAWSYILRRVSRVDQRCAGLPE